jgi:hypothetical protein
VKNPQKPFKKNPKIQGKAKVNRKAKEIELKLIKIAIKLESWDFSDFLYLLDPFFEWCEVDFEVVRDRISGKVVGSNPRI